MLDTGYRPTSFIAQALRLCDIDEEIRLDEETEQLVNGFFGAAVDERAIPLDEAEQFAAPQGLCIVDSLDRQLALADMGLTRHAGQGPIA